MDKVKRFFELKELWKKSSEEERIVIDQELSALMELMNEKELESLTVRVEHDFERMPGRGGDRADEELYLCIPVPGKSCFKSVPG